MQLVDMRNAKCLKTFTTFTGSVTGIHCDPFEPFVFTTSLDRFFRVHHLETKALLHKVIISILYLKNFHYYVLSAFKIVAHKHFQLKNS